MERLTYRDKDGMAMMKERGGWKSWGIDRLAAYEDLMERWKLRSIEEADRIFQRVNALGGTDLMAQYRALGSIDHLRDLLQAEQAGQLVVLPCKVGDTVYMPVGKWNTITGYEADECDGFHIARDGVLQIKAKCYSGNHGTYGIPGKTVFLTREEAEAALALKGGTNDEADSV